MPTASHVRNLSNVCAINNERTKINEWVARILKRIIRVAKNGQKQLNYVAYPGCGYSYPEWWFKIGKELRKLGYKVTYHKVQPTISISW